MFEIIPRCQYTPRVRSKLSPTKRFFTTTWGDTGLHICFLSNGYGEDNAAAQIAGRLKDRHPWSLVTGAPLVTAGDAYTGAGLPVLTQGTPPPSGGFPLKSLRGFLLDVPCVPRYSRYCSVLRNRRAEIDHAVVVGDVALLALGYLSFRRRLIFVELAKSSFKGSHCGIEERLLRRIPCKVLTRDEPTARDLRDRGIDADFLGNPMMDGLTPKGVDLGDGPMVGILPGSRDEAYRNLRRLLAVVERMDEGVRFVCAMPSCLRLERIIESVRADNWAFKDGHLSKNGRSILMARDCFEDVISKSQVILGLAGTANEQAAGVGTPVVSFAGCGPQTTAGRMRDQERLLGGAVKFVRDFPEGVVSELSRLLVDPAERVRRGRIGSLRMGAPGGSDAIVQFLAEEFGLRSASQIAA